MTKKWSSRLTFFAFVVLMVGLGSNDSLRGIFSTIFQEHFSLTTTQLGLIVTASYIGNLVFLLVGGNLSTRFSKKRVLQVLILIWMAALALFAFTSNYTVLLIGMALALGSSTLLNTTMNLITPLLFATAPGSSSTSCSSPRKSAPAAASIFWAATLTALPSGSTQIWCC